MPPRAGLADRVPEAGLVGRAIPRWVDAVPAAKAAVVGSTYARMSATEVERLRRVGGIPCRPPPTRRRGPRVGHVVRAGTTRTGRGLACGRNAPAPTASRRCGATAAALTMFVDAVAASAATCVDTQNGTALARRGALVRRTEAAATGACGRTARAHTDRVDHAGRDRANPVPYVAAAEAAVPPEGGRR
jgi:hypothetical protein